MKTTRRENKDRERAEERKALCYLLIVVVLFLLSAKYGNL